MLLMIPAQSAQIVNVEYIHQLINQKWDITIPYNAELTNPHVAANMKYLLTAVDVANEILNGEPTTDYGSGEFATMVAADTIATNIAVDTLVQQKAKYEFFMTTTDDTSEFTFHIPNTCGKYFVDWGDGTTEVYDENCSDVHLSHSYATSGTYTIKLGGQPTNYTSSSVLRFENIEQVASIDGCLGCVFPTLADGAQPSFEYTFAWAQFTSIPDTLFNGITNQGQYAADSTDMFRGTFAGAKITSIPANLFASLTGPIRWGMFAETFYNTPITSIPENLFAGLDTSEPLAPEAFMYTFGECDSLTGPSAQINGQYLYEIWPDATYDQIGDMYYGATGLGDYNCIPSDWGGGGKNCLSTDPA